ncbi:hypothetical protein B0H13DRAFT_2385881 [Mycena leptocephala]|nr:hypothetical protein B0H13DRAFT_2385881 [Mycena leptocephala]
MLRSHELPVLAFPPRARSLFSARPRSLAFPHTRLPFPARTLVVLRSLFPARALVVLCTPALARISAYPLAVFRTPAPARILARCFSAYPLAVSRMHARCFAPARISAARSLVPARPLAVFRTSTPARRLPRVRSPPRASPPPRLTSLRFASLVFASLGFAALGFASPAKPSQAPNAIKTGYRTSRVWIWGSKNGRQGGVGQSSQKWYQYDEETNSVQEEQANQVENGINMTRRRAPSGRSRMTKSRMVSI